MIKSVSPANAEVSSIKPWGAPISSDGALSQYKSTDWGRWQIPQELFSYHKIPQEKVHIIDLLTPGPLFNNSLGTFFIPLIISGGYGEKGAISSILKFNIYEKPNWSKQAYDMSRPRYYFGISVVDFKYYSKACKYRE